MHNMLLIPDMPDPGAHRPDVSVVIPTLGRPDRLRGAVLSLFDQAGFAAGRFELVVVDNDPAGSARATVEQLAGDAPFAVRYVPMLVPGVANARNAGISAAQAPLIAFLDDDEEAPPQWLSSLLAARELYGADVVFGPVRARIDASIVRHRAYFEQFFSRVGHGDAAGPIADHFGCGNSLIARAALPDQERPFAEARNETGGEDDLLFSQMRARGASFAWAPDAWVWEEATPDRMSLRYTIKRAFSYGQGPSSGCVAADPPRYGKLAFWMIVGLGQFLLYGSLAAVLWLSWAADRAYWLDRAARGLGKLFWFPPFKVAIYGSGAVRAIAAQSTAADGSGLRRAAEPSTLG